MGMYCSKTVTLYISCYNIAKKEIVDLKQDIIYKSAESIEDTIKDITVDYIFAETKWDAGDTVVQIISGEPDVKTHVNCITIFENKMNYIINTTLSATIDYNKTTGHVEMINITSTSPDAVRRVYDVTGYKTIHSHDEYDEKPFTNYQNQEFNEYDFQPVT